MLKDLHPALHLVQVLLVLGQCDVLALRHAHLYLLHLLLAVAFNVLVPWFLVGRILHPEGAALLLYYILSASHSLRHGLFGELSVNIESPDIADRATQVIDTGFEVQVIHLPALFHDVPTKAREVVAVQACEHFNKIVIHRILLVV